MNSLERNLQLWISGSLIILMFIFWWSVTLTSRMLIESYVFTQLEQQAYDLHDAILSDPLNKKRQMESLAAQDAERSYVLGRDVDEVLAVSAGPIWQPQLPNLVPGQSLRVSDSGAEGVSLLGWYGGFNSSEGPFVLGVLQDISIIRDKFALFQWFAAVFAVLILIVLLTVQHIILRRSVEKLEGIRRDMLRLEHGQAVALTEDVPTEIMPLVTEFNQLLRRFEQRLRQSRNAVGNLAHSLKGPLNLLIRSTQADVIGADQKNAITQNTEHIRRLIESELKRARLAGRGAVGIIFDVEAELPAMIGLLEQVYPEKGVDISYSVDPHVKLVHDRQDMLELIGNLLDNAVKWCDKRVVLSLHSADGVVIDVEDDGPGCSPELIGRLTDRGVRLDESVAGYGLGLSIVKDIVDTYNGRLVLGISTAMGGLKVSVFLPDRI